MLHFRLLELRKRKGLSQTELARQLQISRQAYSLYEINKRQMNYDTLCLLADFYSVTTDYLLGRQEALPSFLNEDERARVEQYRLLDERGKTTIRALLDHECALAAKARASKKSAM